MVFQVNKLVSVDFDNGIDPLYLLNTIKESEMEDAMTNLSTVYNDGDDVIIIFLYEPSVDDLVILDQIIADHVPVDSSIDSYTIYPRMQKFAQSVYTVIGKIPYNKKWKVMTIKAKSLMSEEATDYSIKIYDPVTKLTIAENTFTNKLVDVSQNLGVIDNLPTMSREIEILAKINSPEEKPEGIIDSITLIYRIANNN